MGWRADGSYTCDRCENRVDVAKGAMPVYVSDGRSGQRNAYVIMVRGVEIHRCPDPERT
jgi:hypothetical protein